MALRCSAGLVIAAVAVSSSAPGTASATGCTGVQLAPGDNVVTAVHTNPGGQTYCFAPGVYRITAPLVPRSGDSLIGAPGAIIDGGKQVTNWTQSGSVWVASGQTQGPTNNMGGWGDGPMTYPQDVYSDDLSYDNTVLWKVGVKINGKVIGAAASTVGPGQYFFNYDTNTITLGSDPTGHDLEAAIAPGGIDGTGTDVTVEGLTVRHVAGSGISTGGSNWLIQDNDVYLNHLAGITGNYGAQVIDNHAHDNGQYGINGHGANILVEGNEVDHNDNALFGTTSGGCSSAGGSKWVYTTGLVVKDNNYHDNYCTGIWLDLCTDNSLIEGNTSNNNHADGFRIEVGYNATFSGNTATGNSRGGIVALNSPNTQIDGNTVAQNSGSGIVIGYTGRTSPVSSLGQHLVTNNVVSNNNITLAGQQVSGLRVSTDLRTSGVATTWGNQFTGNTYVLPANTNSLIWSGSKMLWPAWQAAGHDTAPAGTANFQP